MSHFPLKAREKKGTLLLGPIISSGLLHQEIKNKYIYFSVSMLPSAHFERFSVSRMRDSFLMFSPVGFPPWWQPINSRLDWHLLVAVGWTILLWTILAVFLWDIILLYAIHLNIRTEFWSVGQGGPTPAFSNFGESGWIRISNVALWWFDISFSFQGAPRNGIHFIFWIE